MTESEYVELYNTERKTILKLVKGILGKDYSGDSEDCVQDVFMDAWKKRETIQNPLEWIKEAARHEAYRTKELGQRYDQWGMPMDMEGVVRCARRLK